MRPAKHATHSHQRPQEIFDISIARLGTEEKGSVPIIATSEREKITLFAWDDAGGSWSSFDIPHVPIEAPRDVPSITNTWNWSRRVGLATFDETITVVYKRSEPVPFDQSPKPPVLMLDIFQVEGGLLRQKLHVSVPVPTFIQATFPPTILRIPETPGFELWSGVDLRRRKLLIVTQMLGENATEKGDGATLTLLLGDLDRLDDEDAWSFQKLDPGGYGLDVRNDGDELILAYRTTPHSLTVPLPIGSIDPFFAGVPQVIFDAQRQSDPAYSKVRLMVLELETLTSSTLDLPGGEHPRIQNIDPLLVVVDRPQLTVRFRIVRNGERIEPRVDWILNGVDKLAFLIDEAQRVARGLLMSFSEGARPTFPRTSSPWIDSQDLFTDITPTGIGWASTKGRFPLEPLKLDRDSKGLYFDFLQKAPLFALLESRVRLNADFQQGVLTATNLQSVVYDINHGQFSLPDALRPDATGENAQFAPFQLLSQQSNIVTAPSYLPDNTIGGSVVSDRDGVPYQFFSYVDLGDGGLRVIYDGDLGPPDALPPIEKPKTLEPERVPGPGSGDERWIELTATDWQDAGVPAILIQNLIERQATVISAVQSQIESLLVAGPTLAGLPPIELAGWSDTQVDSIQTALNTFEVSTGVDPGIVFSTDDIVPRAFISILPEVVVAAAVTTWEAGLEGETVAAVAWRFTSPAVIIQPIVLNVTGNPIALTLPLSGDWTVRATITRNDGTVRTFETVVGVEESLFRKVATVHREIAERELDPPLNSLGSVRIGSAVFTLLQYEVTFTVEADELSAHQILIKTLDKTDAQWRFRAHGTEQGLIDYRFRISFDSSDIRLGGLLSLLLKIESIKASFFYGRSFTPGVLMNDTRSVVPLTGAESSIDGLTHGVDQDEQPRFASALTSRPFSSDSAVKENVKVKVSMLPQAAAASVITLLLGLGAVAAATILTALVAALGVAIAAASAPIVGVVGAAAVIAATIAIFVFINFFVPPMVESAIETNIADGLTSEDNRKSLADSRLLQFAGEAVAESISRQIIDKAIAEGAQLDPPPETATGKDRYRQDLFQMIHVSDGRARVLIRA